MHTADDVFVSAGRWDKTTQTFIASDVHYFILTKFLEYRLVQIYTVSEQVLLQRFVHGRRIVLGGRRGEMQVHAFA